ncbi:hypothetical protein G9E11_01895 [Arthrobacter sp. IA7]|uniref:hypothetical protein n=1 Tax=Arthrobacter ipis TaxID=2716202 RepID=UPI001683E696|nr:hypothetical protein [Arthrobacter ipis]MBD1541026.1 hypothetical protein [Arthrobacter ipis]
MAKTEEKKETVTLTSPEGTQVTVSAELGGKLVAGSGFKKAAATKTAAKSE